MIEYDKVIFQDLPDLLNMKQLQKALRIGRSAAYKFVHSGAVPFVRIGNQIRVPKLELILFLQINANRCYNNNSCSTEQAVGKEYCSNDSKFES